MYCVLFEVEPREGLADTYFELAMGMRAEVEKIDGFLSVERFSSDARPGLYLSYSKWRDEAALIEWRNVGKHRIMQARGRRDIFSAYRIRIGHADERISERSVLVSEHSGGETASADVVGEQFTGVLDPARALSLLDPRANTPTQSSQARLYRIIRDYTMIDRAEAPQPAPL